MTHLHERRFLKCPYSRARGYLRDALQNLAETHEAKKLTLRVPFADKITEVSLQQDVNATYALGADPTHFDQPWKIHWKAPHGPYPEFDGELTVRADEDYPTSILELTGNYRPPLGAAGVVFDAIAGSRIADATAKELIRSLGHAMEQQYDAEEKAKRPSPT